MTPDLHGILDRFTKGYGDPGMRTAPNFLVALADELQPKHILEVGTGPGWGARLMIQVVPKGNRITAVKLAGQHAEALDPWKDVKRLSIIAEGDPVQGEPVDLLLIHHVPSSQAAWHDYVKYLADPCVVAVDSVGVRDAEWWRSLPYQTITTNLNPDGFGMFVWRTP